MTLDAFREQIGIDDDETSIHDLIADLGHYCTLHDLDILTVTARAISCWCVERFDPDGMNLGPRTAVRRGRLRVR